MRVLIYVSDDGTEYAGWQRQNDARSIQGELEKAASALFGQEIEMIGASRTDAGVHSAGSAAVFDVETRMPAEKVCYALNQKLPEDIRVMRSHEVPGDFHPRHTDSEKTYLYRIYVGRIMDPRFSRFMYQVHVPLDFEAMCKAAKYIEGKHDFKSFSSTGTQVTDFVREVYDVKLSKTPLSALSPNEIEPYEIDIRVHGNGFLYNMVRIIAGTLIEVGKGNIKPSDLSDIIAACDREAAGPTAPANGLALETIRFLELED